MPSSNLCGPVCVHPADATPQMFTFDPKSGSITRQTDGKCIDVAFCGNSVCPSMDLELYDCGSPYDNQVNEAMFRGKRNTRVRLSPKHATHVPIAHIRTLHMIRPRVSCMPSSTVTFAWPPAEVSVSKPS